MRMAYELCLASAGKQVPSGPDWIHEVKHDGYRMLVIRENDRVRLFSRTAATGPSAIHGLLMPRSRTARSIS